jgi:WD40 repeat protein
MASFDVFLSHHSADKPAVEELARRLAQEGIEPWLDKWHLIPGDAWQPAIEKALADAAACAVFIGPGGFGSWQNEEMRAAIARRVQDSKGAYRVIPVLLPGGERAERSSLPTFLVAATWVEFRQSLDEEDAFRRLVCGIRGREPGPGLGEAVHEGRCPFRGLRFFDVDDAPFFFGREALVEWLLNALRPAAGDKPVSRILAIVGASGSGKSSVARAGLVAALKRGGIAGSAEWPIAICRPGPSPTESLAIALSKVLDLGQRASAIVDLAADLQKSEKTLHLVVRRALPENAPDRRLVVLVDQFEEVFSLCHNESERRAFIGNLLYAAKVAQGQALVILTMRADFYGKCAADAELAAAVSDHHVLVGPMTEDEVRRAIERPVQLVGCEFEAGLVEMLVEDVMHQPGALPLLQHALLELWNRRGGRRLTIESYREIGKLEGALQRRADATIEGMSESERELCRRIFLRLTQPGEGTEDTRRRVGIGELLSSSGENAGTEALVQKLVDASLLTAEGELSAAGGFAEVAHEALIRSWPQLRKWIDTDRSGLRTRSRLTEAAQEWLRAKRDPAYLYVGGRLVLTKEWAEAHPGELSPEEAEFLETSSAAQRQREQSELEVAQRLAHAETARAAEAEHRVAEQKAAARRLKHRARIVAGVAIVALLSLGAALMMWRRSNAEKRQGEILRLSAEASVVSADFPQRGLLLAIEAARLAEEYPELRGPGTQRAMREILGRIGGACVGRIDGKVTAVAVSSDGKWRAAGNEQGTVQWWPAPGSGSLSEPHVLKGHRGSIFALGSSSDGRWLISASEDSVRLWEVSSGNPAAGAVVLAGHAGRIFNIAIGTAPKSRWLATACEDGVVRVWDLLAPGAVAGPAMTLRGHTGPVRAVSISPDDRWLVSGGDDGTARVWDSSAPEASPVILDVKRKVRAVAVTSTPAEPVTPAGSRAGTAALGEWVVAGDEDGAMYLWRFPVVDSAEKPLIFAGQNDGAIDGVELSPNGRWLVSDTTDGNTRLWDLQAADPAANPLAVRGREGEGLVAAIGTDSRWLVTGSEEDGAARLWDLTSADPTSNPLVLRGHDRPLGAVALSRGAHFLITGSDAGTVRIWDLAGDALVADPRILRGHKGPLNAVSLSADQRWVATGSTDATVRLWDLQSADVAAAPVVLSVKGGGVMDMAFTPDSRQMVTCRDDRKVRWWNLSAPSQPSATMTLDDPSGQIKEASISEDCRWLVTGSTDGSARLWDLNGTGPSLKPARVFQTHAGTVWCSAMTSDDRWLFTGNADGTVRIWDLAAASPEAAPKAVLKGHRGDVWVIAVSPGNRQLFTGGEDQTIRIWDLAKPEAPPQILHGALGAIYALALSPDGHWLATGTVQGAAHLWDLTAPDPAANPLILRGHTGAIYDTAISRDSRWLVTGSSDATARLWRLKWPELLDLSRITVGRNLSEREWTHNIPWEKYRRTFEQLPIPTDATDPVPPSASGGQ